MKRMEEDQNGLNIHPHILRLGPRETHKQFDDGNSDVYNQWISPGVHKKVNNSNGKGKYTVSYRGFKKFSFKDSMTQKKFYEYLLNKNLLLNKLML